MFDQQTLFVMGRTANKSKKKEEGRAKSKHMKPMIPATALMSHKRSSTDVLRG